MRIVRRCRR